MIELELPESWSFRDDGAPSARRRSGTLTGPDGARVAAVLERCITGRLAATYPTGVHDVEVRLDAPGDELGAAAVLADAVLRGDPTCHRVVFAAPAGDQSVIGAAEAAGFRYVVDVDIPDAELSLLVVEPPSVTGQPADVEQMPTSVRFGPLT
jgi:hypothetical protein